MTSSEADIEKRRRQGFEALAVIFLSLATVGMAWCSYQASAWNSQSSKESIQSVARGRDASVFRMKADQILTLDIFLFSQYLRARYATNEPLADFYARQFSPELKQAYLAQGSSPNSPNTPIDPFITNLYRSPWLARADALEPESDQMWHESIEDSKTGQRYTLISVLLATALFFSGTAPQFETRRKRRIILALGLASLLVALGMFLALPRPPEASSLELPRKVNQ